MGLLGCVGGGGWSGFLPTASFGKDNEVLVENIELLEGREGEETGEIGRYKGWLGGL